MPSGRGTLPAPIYSRRFGTSRLMRFAGRFLSSVDTSPRLIDRGERDIRIGLLIGSFHGLKCLIKLMTSPIGLNITSEFGMIRQHSHVIIEHFDETTIYGEHPGSATALISEDAGS